MANWLLYPQIGGARRARSSMLWLMTLSLVAVGGTSGMSASQLEETKTDSTFLKWNKVVPGQQSPYFKEQ